MTSLQLNVEVVPADLLPRWLIDTQTFELVDTVLLKRLQDHNGGILLKDNGRYAIVSHRWSHSVRDTSWDGAEIGHDRYQQEYQRDPAGEGTNPNANAPMLESLVRRLRSYQSLSYDEAPGLTKIARACDLAVKHGIPYIWIDTCCIKKASPDETRKALNSMFRYYRQAAVCYVFMTDVSNRIEHHRSEIYRRSPESRSEMDHVCKIGFFGESGWFQSGWTLQELLAPRQLLFFDHSWNCIGNKDSLLPDLARATGISEKDLETNVEELLDRTCIAVKMSWAALRKTKYKEDMAYCMFGILQVDDMPISYGEEEYAFMRLQERLVEKFTDESIFAWTLYPQPSTSPLKQYGMLAPWITCFAGLSRAKIVPRTGNSRMPRQSPGFRPFRQGIEVKLPMKMPDHNEGFHWNDSEAAKMTEYKLGLNCWIEGQESSGSVTIHLRRSNTSAPWRREFPSDMILGHNLKPSFKDAPFKFQGIKFNKTRPQYIPNIRPRDSLNADPHEKQELKRLEDAERAVAAELARMVPVSRALDPPDPPSRPLERQHAKGGILGKIWRRN